MKYNESELIKKKIKVICKYKLIFLLLDLIGINLLSPVTFKVPINISQQPPIAHLSVD